MSSPESYTKLFASITASTVWCESSDTRVVWVTMLAMADQYGRVSASMPGLARMANVTQKACEFALRKFLAPDPHSRTPDNEGRRIEPIDGGWRLLNHAKYRNLIDEEHHRSKNAERQRRFRQRHSPDVTLCVTENNPIAEAEADTEEESKSKDLLGDAIQDQPIDANSSFEQFWNLYPNKVGKKNSRDEWDKLEVTAALHAAILAGLDRWKSSDRWRRGYIVDPERFLKRRLWEDNPNNGPPRAPTADEKRETSRRQALEEMNGDHHATK